MNNLSKNILSTIAYYDVMDYPMTAFEIWKYLIESQKSKVKSQNEANNFSLANVIKELETEEVGKYVSEFCGFYFLKKREELVNQRLEREKISQKKIKRARKAVFWLRLVPFVKMIAVAGRVGMKNAKRESDVDFLMVFSRGKIFTGRFLATALVHFLGRRRYKNKIANRICFNHFLSDEFCVSVQDLYSSHSYLFAIPLYGGDHFPKFLAKNQWIKNYRLNFSFLEKNIKEMKDSRFSFGVKFLLEKIFSPDWIEQKLKKMQIEKIKKNPLTQKNGGVVIYNDSELAFWPDFESQGPKIFEQFQENLTKFNQIDN